MRLFHNQSDVSSSPLCRCLASCSPEEVGRGAGEGIEQGTGVDVDVGTGRKWAIARWVLQERGWW